MPSLWTNTRSDDPGIGFNIRGLQDFGRVAVIVDGARQNFLVARYNAAFQYFDISKAGSALSIFGTNTADVLTEATAEFAFFMMGILARKMWQSERLVREAKWPSWHPFLPFLGDEVTGKTIAVIGTGRIGLAMIKKCSGFDMNILCYDPAYQNHEFIQAIQNLMDLRHARGIQKEKTRIKYVDFEEALRGADYVSLHVPLLREGEADKPTFHLINENTLKLMKPTAYLINS